MTRRVELAPFAAEETRDGVIDVGRLDCQPCARPGKLARPREHVARPALMLDVFVHADAVEGAFRQLGVEEGTGQRIHTQSRADCPGHLRVEIEPYAITSAQAVQMV